MEDAYDRGKLMGCYAEDTATKYQFTRDAQDDFAIESLSRAKKAIEDETFKAEVEPVTVNTRKGEFVIEREPGKLADPGSQRVSNLVNKHPCFRSLIAMPEVLVAAHHVLKNDYRVSDVESREPQKGGGLQEMHIDWEPRMKEIDSFDSLVCYFAVDEMRLDNGPLRVVPGTHTKLDWPDEYIDVNAKHPDEIYVEAEAGARIIFNTLLWHSGTESKSEARRRVIFTQYRRRDLPQLLNLQMYLSDEVKQSLDDAERWLLSVGPEFPVDKTRHYGPGNAYRQRYNIDPEAK